jgi:threonine/homoserine/homoserine lactone efflux protein
MNQFYIIAVAHFLALISPGQDMLVVLKEFSTSNRHAVFAILGITVSNVIHIIISLAGIDVILLSNPNILTGFKVLMGLYLIYVGIMMIVSKHGVKVTHGRHKKHRLLHSFTGGLSVSIINPKVTLFYFALFSQAVSPETPTYTKVGYGIYLAIATGVGFGLLLILLNIPLLRRVFDKCMAIIQKITGGILIALGIKTIIG